MSNVTVTIKGDKLSVSSPYNTRWNPHAKRLGGRWDAGSRTWVFDAQAEEHVRAALLTVYGDDGQEAVRQVRIRITAIAGGGHWQCGPATFRGIPIASASGRDSGARVSAGVVQIAGKIGSSGSRANWSTDVHEGAQFELTVPEALALPVPNWDVDVLRDVTTVDREALTVERERLTARLTEIDTLLGSAPTS